MATFLTGNNLSKKIKKICRGDNVQCAVAFWGNGAVEGLFGKHTERQKAARIICDLSMGGTNPCELKKIGAPNSHRIKHLTGLHAKVYLSSNGLVVGSANASDNGVGFSFDSSKLFEAGTYHKANTPAWEAASKWFCKWWDCAQKVSRGDLDRARERWKRRNEQSHASRTGKANEAALSIVENILLRPEVFGTVEIVVSNGDIDTQILKNAEDEARANSKLPDPTDFSYQGWGVKREDWPLRFLAIHENRNGKISADFYTPGFIVGDDVHFVYKDPVRRNFAEVITFFSNMKIKKSDLPSRLIEKLADSGGIFTAAEFRKELVEWQDGT